MSIPVFRLLAGLALGLAVGGCATGPRSPPSAGGALARDTPPVPTGTDMSLASLIPGFRQPTPTLITGGQPDANAWQAAAAKGVTTVINLRPDSELGARDEAGEVRGAGLVYRQLPVDGAGDMTEANARTLWQWIQDAPGTVLVHCGSGNRVGALLAIAAAREGGMAPEAAIDYGKSAGLGSAEARVREVLGTPPAD